MSIEASITVTIAEVEVSDQCTVTLTTRTKLTDLAPDEAVQLAAELVEAAKEADAAIRDDLAQRRVSHGFDVDLPTGHAIVAGEIVPLVEVCRWCDHEQHLGLVCQSDMCPCDLRQVAS